MKKPIIVDSNIEFVIIGPILDKDGIIIQSTEVGIDLIGIAYMNYRGDNLHREAISISKVGHVWGDYKSFDDRRSKLLFCWRINENNFNKFESDKYGIEGEFNRFIENSFTVLKKLVKGNQNSEDYETWNAIITWNISPLLLKCKFPKTYF